MHKLFNRQGINIRFYFNFLINELFLVNNYLIDKNVFIYNSNKKVLIY